MITNELLTGYYFVQDQYDPTFPIQAEESQKSD